MYLEQGWPQCGCHQEDPREPGGTDTEWDKSAFGLCHDVNIVEKTCDILGFPGNATMKRTCPHNNEADTSRQQSKQRAVTMDTV
jgi:hypothetical protein